MKPFVFLQQINKEFRQYMGNQLKEVGAKEKANEGEGAIEKKMVKKGKRVRKVEGKGKGKQRRKEKEGGEEDEEAGVKVRNTNINKIILIESLIVLPDNQNEIEGRFLTWAPGVMKKSTWRIGKWS